MAGEYGDWGMKRRGVRADMGRTNGERGGMVMFISDLAEGGEEIVVGGDLGWSQLQQLLALEEWFEEVGDGLSAGTAPEVDIMEEALEAVEVVEVIEATEAAEEVRLSPKLNFELVPVARGLISTGDRVLRKSRYAAGGVMGVCWPSSRLIWVGVDTIGLRSSDG